MSGGHQAAACAAQALKGAEDISPGDVHPDLLYTNWAARPTLVMHRGILFSGGTPRPEGLLLKDSAFFSVAELLGSCPYELCALFKFSTA